MFALIENWPVSPEALAEPDVRLAPQFDCRAIAAGLYYDQGKGISRPPEQMTSRDSCLQFAFEVFAALLF